MCIGPCGKRAHTAEERSERGSGTQAGMCGEIKLLRNTGAPVMMVFGCFELQPHEWQLQAFNLELPAKNENIKTMGSSSLRCLSLPLFGRRTSSHTPTLEYSKSTLSHSEYR